MIVTIDGPVATGKSTVAKKVAERLGYIHFDTGAIYRCVTAFCLKHKIPYQNLTILNEALKDFTFEIVLKNGIKHYFVDGEDVTDHIRGEAVTKEVSHVSAIKLVREKLVSWQREWAKKEGNAVFEGRDLGSIVFPKAELKIYLTGSDEVRSLRRYNEMVQKFPEKTFTLPGVLSDLRERDYLDMTRTVSPLIKAEDAVEIDTSSLTADQVVDQIVDLAHARGAKDR
jgi:cytidylate kinase